MKWTKSASALLLCMILFACLLPAAWADGTEAAEITALRDAIANGETLYTLNSGGEFTLAKVLIIPKNFTLKIQNGSKLILPQGVDLANDGKLVVEDSGEISVAAGSTLYNTAKLNIADNGVIRISGTFRGIPGSFTVIEDENLEDGLPQLIVKDGGEFHGMGGCAITKTILNSFDRSAIIQGVNLGQWCDAEMIDMVVFFPGADINFAYFKFMLGSKMYTPFRLRGTGDFTLEDDLTIPDGVDLRVRNDSTLIVPVGKTLTVNGRIEASNEGEIDVLGNLSNSAGTTPAGKPIALGNGGVIHVTGTIENDDTFLFGSKDHPEEAAPSLIVDEGATVTGTFRIQRYYEPGDVIQGISLDSYCSQIIHVINGEIEYFLPPPDGRPYLENRLPNVEYMEIHGVDEYVLSRDIEIPVFDDGTAAYLNLANTNLVVPNGVTMTVNGTLTVRKLEIEQGGSVVVNEGGHLTARGSITTNNGASITVNDAVIEGGYNSSLPSTLSNASFTGDAVVRLYSRLVEPEKAQRILNEAVNVAAIEHVEAVVSICCDWTMPVDVTLPNRVSLEVTDNENGILTIPQGKTLTVSEGAELRVKGNDLTVNGTLVNNGKILLGGDEHAAEVVLGVKGIYCGNGLIDRMNQPYMILNNKSAADMILPESLQTIESEALAGGVFTSVYIPPSVTTIAPDAFGNRTELIILGSSGSYAETFAGLKHFTFAPAA